MAKIKIRYLLVDTTRHGQKRLYVRLPGRPMIRLQVDSTDDPNFGIAYAAALKGEKWFPPVRRTIAPPKVQKALPGSFRALCQDYFAYLSKETKLSKRTKYVRRLHLENVCLEPTKPNAPHFMGDVPFLKFGRDHVLAVRDRKIATPEAANGLHKALSALFAYALDRRLVPENPALLVRRISPSGSGFKPWTEVEIAKFVTRHPIGSKAYLAFALLFYTGQRRADIVEFGRQHVKDEELRFVQQKNRNRAPKPMVIPIAPELRAVIDASPTGDLHFLETEFHKPFTAAGFGNWFRDRCNEAELSGYSAHGLRKTFQIIGAEAGLSDRELMGLAGHENPKMTSLYTKDRDRAASNKIAIRKLSAAHFGNRIVAPLVSEQKSATNISKNIK